MFESFDFQQMISAFIVLFAVIDIIGSIPIIINLKEKGKDVNAMKATVISFLLMIGHFQKELSLKHRICLIVRDLFRNGTNRGRCFSPILSD